MSKDENNPIKKLSDRIRQSSASIKKSRQANHQNNPIGIAFRLGVEMVSALIVGGLMGWGIDKLLGTKPWFMIIFFLFGAIAGMLNVIKTGKKINKQ